MSKQGTTDKLEKIYQRIGKDMRHLALPAKWFLPFDRKREMMKAIRDIADQYLESLEGAEERLGLCRRPSTSNGG